VTRSKTRTHRKTLALATAVAAVLGLMAMASSASAVVHHPKGEFAPFADCPLSNPAAGNCLLATTEGGEFVIGKEKVPLAKTQILQGGIEFFASGEEKVVAAEDGKHPAENAAESSRGLGRLGQMQ